MLNEWIWKVIQLIHPGLVTYAVCGLLLLLFLLWLLIFPMGRSARLSHSLRKMNRELLLGGSAAENVTRLDDLSKPPLLERMWEDYCDDYTGGNAAPACQYIAEKELETAVRNKTAGMFKLLHGLITLAGVLLGALFTAVRWELSFWQLLMDDNVAFMVITILAVAAILWIFYILIERVAAQGLQRQWERFCDLCTKRLPVFYPARDSVKLLQRLSSLERLLLSANQSLSEGKEHPEQPDLEMEYLERLSTGFISETTGTLTGYVQQLSAVLESNTKTQQLLRDSLKLLLNDLSATVHDQRTLNSELTQMLQKLREQGEKQ